MLHVLLASVGDSIRGLRDAVLLQLAYDTLCRRSELVTLRIDDVVAAPHADGMRHSILLRRSKVVKKHVVDGYPCGTKRCSR
jgi:site-specific recombinase XerD